MRKQTSIGGARTPIGRSDGSPSDTRPGSDQGVALVIANTQFDWERTHDQEAAHVHQ